MVISTAFLRINFISQIDTNLFLFINHLPHNLFLDNFFGLLSFVGEYGTVWFVLTFLLFLKNLAPHRTVRSYEAKKLAIIYITGLVSLTLVFFLKEIFHRPRPEFVLQNVILPFGPDSSFSFPSGHALISFVFATLLVELGQFGKLGKTIIYSLTLFISFSRLYLGYHYPLDLVAGAVMGILVARVAIKIFKVLAIRK